MRACSTRYFQSVACDDPLLTEVEATCSQALLGQVDICDSKLPRADTVGHVRAKAFPARDAELDGAITLRDEVWEICSLIGDGEAQADIAVSFGVQLNDEQDGYEPLE